MNLINSITIPEKVDKVIRDYIGNFETSTMLEKMKHGEEYYRSRNTKIYDRKMMVYTETEDGVPLEMEDPYKSNNKLASGYLKILIDQKINYSLGNKISINFENDDLSIDDVFGFNFQKKLKKIGKEASKKSIGWGHVYIDGEGQLQIVVIPSEEIIPVYTNYDNEKLAMVIRYYSVSVQNEKGDSVQVNRVEVWDEETVTYYQENTGSHVYYLLDEQDMYSIFQKPYQNPKFHFEKNITFGDSVADRQGVSWGMIPFVPLFNNDEEETDLQPVKSYIDVYDLVESDFANNLEDFQDIYWILKGYDGENVGRFLEQVKRYKTLKVSEDGDARSERIDIPYEARKEMLMNLEKNIYQFGMGVNTNQVGDGNITNVVIRTRFANLDLKASQFETEVRDFLRKLLFLINKYREIKNMEQVEIESITFDRSLIINEIELLEANVKQIGAVSEKTRLSNHKWVSDAEEEIERMNENNVTLSIDGE